MDGAFPGCVNYWMVVWSKYNMLFPCEVANLIKLIWICFNQVFVELIGVLSDGVTGVFVS